MTILFNNKENALKYLSGEDLGRVIQEDMVTSILNHYPIEKETDIIDILYLPGENNHLSPIMQLSDLTEGKLTTLELEELRLNILLSTLEMEAIRITVSEGELDLVLDELENHFVELEEFEWCSLIKKEKDKYKVLAN